jgi:Ca2+-binding RTX toxin-like protein
VLYGGNGDDILIGNSGLDTIYDGAGRDSLYGGVEPEADRFVLSPGDGAVDAIWDFSGSSGDKIDLTLFAAGATVSFAGGILTVNGEQVVQIQGDFVLGRDVILTSAPPGVGENWTGTPGADTRLGTAYNDSLSGLGGNDTLDGSGGNDTIKAANGDDLIRGGEGDDYLSGNAGADSIFDGAGRDSLYGGSQADRFVLTAGDNSLDGVYDFKGTEGDRIDLSLFANKTGIAYTGGVLWVNGEAVAEVFGTFDPALHLIL